MSPVLFLHGPEQLQWFVANHNIVIIATAYASTLFPSELKELALKEVPEAAFAAAVASDLQQLVAAPVSFGDVLFFAKGELMSKAKSHSTSTTSAEDLVALLAAIASKTTATYLHDQDTRRRSEARERWMPHLRTARAAAEAVARRALHPLSFLGLTSQSTLRDRKRIGRLIAKLLHDDRLHGFNDDERRQIRELHLFLMEELRKAA